MTDHPQPRRLAVIVAVDVAGFSARMESNESASAAEVVKLRDRIREIAHSHEGRVFNTAGDGFMLEFASGLNAARAAVELAETCEPPVRVGVHLGDVQVQPNADLLGHGVNVAARLMAKSQPGSALISSNVRQTLHDAIVDRFISLGTHKLEKMSETIEVFELVAKDGTDRTQRPIQRKLAAILITDMVGYNNLLEIDETGTHRKLMANRNKIVEPQIRLHSGRVIKYVADTMLAEFSSAVAAVSCALSIQQATEAAANASAEADPVHYRIGINLGEVISEDGEIYGDGVTVAARLQHYAPVGGIAISQTVRDQVEGKVPCSFEELETPATSPSGRRSIHVFLVRDNQTPGGSTS